MLQIFYSLLLEVTISIIMFLLAYKMNYLVVEACMNTQEKIGAKLKELRLRKGVTQQEVADRIGGLTRNYISQMESGKRKISIEFLQKMADLFNVDITYFFEEGNQVSLSEEEKAWVLDLRELERQGVSAEDVRKWVKMAREIRDK